jgi:4-diphosphocytidyl-2-C-methyl-D-erythritol kinase
MVVFPNAKINIGLNVVSKRPDGYHNLQTVFYPVPLYDVLEIIEAKDKSDTIFIVDVQDTSLQQDNLCLKAVKLLRKDFNIPPVNIYLKKNIPMGAGMGGGSSDASFTIKLLNDKFSLQLNETQMADYALKLGADCPFFIYNKLLYAAGIGEKFTKNKLSLKDKWLCIVFPNLHISTKEAFAGIEPKESDFDLKKLDTLPLEKWRDLIKNDFEKSAFAKYPKLKNIKNTLYKSGAIYASMTGSGSAFYGIFDNKQTITFNESYMVKWVKLN